MPQELPPPDRASPFRRVVTGVGPDGRSAVVSDGPVPAGGTWAETGIGRGADPWIVWSVPVDLADETDPLAEHVLQEWPPSGGAIARMITWEPGFAFPMHRSDTLDIGWVLAGEIELLLETDSIRLRAGDAVVQRGTVHGWRVVGEEPCTVAMILVGASRVEAP